MHLEVLNPKLERDAKRLIQFVTKRETMFSVRRSIKTRQSIFEDEVSTLSRIPERYSFFVAQGKRNRGIEGRRHTEDASPNRAATN